MAIPDRLSIDLKDRELYEKIVEQGMFAAKTRKEQFLFAMALGVRNEIFQALKTKEGFFLAKDLRPEDEAMVNSVALWHNKEAVDILSDIESVYRIAEEYAHGGIRLLVDKIDSVEFGSFWKQFEKDICEKFDSLALEAGNEDDASSAR